MKFIFFFFFLGGGLKRNMLILYDFILGLRKSPVS